MTYPEMISEGKELLKKVNWQINLALKGKPQELYQAGQHLSKAGGKRIRPVLCILSCESTGGKIEDALPTAASLELIHTFSLIHDDIMDEDHLRRGQSSVHTVYGEPTAILAGDLLFSKAFELCHPKAKDALAGASTLLCEGQKMDLSFESREKISEEEYLEMIQKKTAALFEASAKSGAILGNASEEVINFFAKYGKNLGMAFQIYDDILGIVGKEEKVGKPVGSDISQGKKSLVIVKGLELCEGKEREKLLSILKSRGNSKDELQEAISLIKDSGAVEKCKEKAENYVEEAKKSLREIPGSDPKKSLIKIADFVIKREV